MNNSNNIKKRLGMVYFALNLVLLYKMTKEEFISNIPGLF